MISHTTGLAEVWSYNRHVRKMREPEHAKVPGAEQEIAAEQARLRRDVRTAVDQIEAGEAVSNRQAKARLRRRFSG
jgi:hypothetical protein